MRTLAAAVVIAIAPIAGAQDHEHCPMAASPEHGAAVDRRHDEATGVGARGERASLPARKGRRLHPARGEGRRRHGGTRPDPRAPSGHLAGVRRGRFLHADADSRPDAAGGRGHGRAEGGDPLLLRIHGKGWRSWRSRPTMPRHGKPSTASCASRSPTTAREIRPSNIDTWRPHPLDDFAPPSSPDWPA